jgi:hypothetical protein
MAIRSACRAVEPRYGAWHLFKEMAATSSRRPIGLDRDIGYFRGMVAGTGLPQGTTFDGDRYPELATELAGEHKCRKKTI